MIHSSVTDNGMKKRSSLLSDASVVVIAAAFWVNFCLLGVLRSNAVIYKAFVDVFEVNRQYAAWPSGMFGFFMCVTGALSGFLSHHFSTRILAVIGAILASASVSICSLATEMPQILFLYGALQGIGMGLIVPLTHVILNQNCTKYRACALGIAYSGSSLGSFVFPSLTNLLLEKFDLRGTFLLLGGIMSNSLMGALLFRSSPSLKKLPSQSNTNKKVLEVRLHERNKYLVSTIALNNEEKTSKDNRKNTSSLKIAMEVLSSPYFFLVSSAYAAYFSTSAIFLMVVLDFAKDRGISIDEGVFLISAFSIGDFVGRLTFGWVADVQCVRRNILVRCYLVTMGLLTALLPVCPTKGLLAASILLGIVNGSIIVNHSVLLNEYLGIQKLPIAMGFSTCFVGITAFLRPFLIGAFRDRNQNYDYVFLVMGLIQITVTLLWFLETFIQFIHKKYILKPIVK